MADRQDEIDALRAQVAALTARVYQLEQMSGVASAARQQAIPQARQQTPAPPAAGTMPQPPSAQVSSGPRAPGATPPPQPLTEPQLSRLSGSTKEDSDL